MTENRIVWIDIETTGLDPKKDAVLEVAVVITDDDLRVVDEHAVVIRPTSWREKRALRKANEFVVSMHSKSGLLAELATSKGLSLALAEKELLAFLDSHDLTSRLLLAGNSVHFDRAFLNEKMPTLMKRFGHQNLDVTSVSHCIRRWNKPSYDELKDQSGEVVHRATDDIHSSIAQLAWYRKSIVHNYYEAS
jgi:oligoribonuclease